MVRVLGIVLVALGIVGLAYGGITWKHSKKVVDLGSIQVTQQKTERFPFPPVAGGISLVAGVWLIAGTRRRVS